MQRVTTDRPRGWGAAAAVFAVVLAGLCISAPLAHAGRGECSASAKVKKGGERFNVAYELSCDFQVELVTLSTDKRVNRVKRKPTLTIPDGNDGSFVCERVARHGARCTGHVHKSTVIRGALHLRRPCRRPRAKLDLDILGGVDCNDGPCPANALGSKKTVSVTGC